MTQGDLPTIIFCNTFSSTNSSTGKIITRPILSNPRRPARPAICKYSSVCKNRIPPLENLDSLVKIAVLVGALIPTAKVSVQKSILTRPCSNKISTISFNTGITPEW